MLELAQTQSSFLETLLLAAPLVYTPTPSPSAVPALVLLGLASFSTLSHFSSATCGALVGASLLLDWSVDDDFARLLVFLATLLFALIISSLRKRHRNPLTIFSALLVFILTLPYLRPFATRTLLYASIACIPFSNASMTADYDISDFEAVLITLIFGLTQELSSSVTQSPMLVDRSLCVGLLALSSVSRTALTVIFIQTFTPRSIWQGKRVEWMFFSVSICHLAGLYTSLLFLFKQDPFLGLIDFIFMKQRWSVLFCWSALLGVSLPMIGRIAVHRRVSLAVVRKLFHFLACLLFTPVLIFDPEMMNFSFSIALSLMIMLETVRFIRCTVIFEYIEKYYSPFCGEIGGRNTLHHIYLLGGCAMPSLFHSLRLVKQMPLVPFLGILTLCIGDSFVSGQLYVLAASLIRFRAQSSGHISDVTVFVGRSPRRHWRARWACVPRCGYFAGFFGASP